MIPSQRNTRRMDLGLGHTPTTQIGIRSWTGLVTRPRSIRPVRSPPGIVLRHPDGDLGPRLEAQLRQDVRDVPGYRGRADDQLPGDGPVRHPAGHQGGDLPLARGKPGTGAVRAETAPRAGAVAGLGGYRAERERDGLVRTQPRARRPQPGHPGLAEVAAARG